MNENPEIQSLPSGATFTVNLPSGLESWFRSLLETIDKNFALIQQRLSRLEAESEAVRNIVNANAAASEQQAQIKEMLLVQHAESLAQLHADVDALKRRLTGI